MTMDSSEKPHVLLVDDEAISALALQRFLARKGYRVTTAGDGLAALDLDAADPADLVVTDVRMPKLGGTELVRRLRQTRPDLPVVIVTGYMAADPEAAGLTGPRTVVLTKPLDPEALLATVREMLPA
ncbi:response regulator [Aerophototrophica crusticola]|uniref:Response regulator n=1 Tax=Aerophototrophica crusticola TaxID=1709002 RepID=A0A858R9I7_9PROT|nr:response regulator [Rhodospirillaceae bacterium B3]